MVNIHPLSLPLDKFDIESATALTLASWESLEPLMPQVLEWMQDINWPVADVLQPFLASLGVRLAPFIQTVFATDDDIWKFNILVHIVAHSPELVTALRADLERMANNPTAREQSE